MSFRRSEDYKSENEGERVALVGMQTNEESLEDVNSSLDELQRLIETLGGKVLSRYVQKKDKPSASTYIGTGKAREIGAEIKEQEIALVAFDVELTGGQQKNLENVLGCRVVDRTGVILDIFSRHARTKESKNQVEVASLEYMSSRLNRKWTHLERQRGGIGLRGGAGERQIEVDRRMIRVKIAKLKEEIAHFAKDRETQSRHRDRFLRVAIVGYTNAGKSTVMNNLTMAEVYVDDRLFATLDPTVRVIDPKTRPPILLSDTVGFIKKLPHSLVASFRSTLREVVDADLLLHVVDTSSENYQEQITVTKEVLDELGAGDKPSMLVFNKADLVKDFYLPKLLQRSYIDSLVVSAHVPEDMKRLRDTIYAYFERDMLEMDVVVPYQDTWLQSQIHEFAKILEKKYLEDGAHFKIRIMRTDASWLKILEPKSLS